MTKRASATKAPSLDPARQGIANALAALLVADLTTHPTEEPVTDHALPAPTVTTPAGSARGPRRVQALPAPRTAERAIPCPRSRSALVGPSPALEEGLRP